MAVELAGSLAGPTVTHRPGLTFLILLLGLPPWMIVLVIALMQFLPESFVARLYAIAQIFVTPLALMTTELVHSSSPGTLLVDRTLQTLPSVLLWCSACVLPAARSFVAYTKQLKPLRQCGLPAGPSRQHSTHHRQMHADWVHRRTVRIAASEEARSCTAQLHVNVFPNDTGFR